MRAAQLTWNGFQREDTKHLLFGGEGEGCLENSVDVVIFELMIFCAGFHGVAG